MAGDVSLSTALRTSGVKTVELSVAILQQFGKALSNRSRDGQPVSLELNSDARKFLITIGEGSRATTMSISARGEIEMSGVSMSQSDFLRRLQLVGGGRAKV